MPTIRRFDGWRVVIYSNDHRPAHVHVIGPDGEAVFNLQCPHGPPALRASYRLNRSELSTIKKALTGNLASLCHDWRSIHGDY
jgi:hypothetical protein